MSNYPNHVWAGGFQTGRKIREGIESFKWSRICEFSFNGRVGIEGITTT